MKKEKKPFLPHPRYKPVANFIFAFFACIFIFFIIYSLQFLDGNYYLIEVILTGVLAVFFFTGLYNLLKFGYDFYIKGGWKQEHQEYLDSLKPKQPWDK